MRRWSCRQSRQGLALLDGNSAQPPTRSRRPTACCGRRLQLLATGHALPVRADRRLHRTADARRPALGQFRPRLYPRGHDADACQDVEVIGWLYQFYISEKKDEVFAGLKKTRRSCRKTSPPPPNFSRRTGSCAIWWKIRSAGCGCSTDPNPCWSSTCPTTSARAAGDRFPALASRGISICDPACGSGHMLTYAFDLLYAIYEEEGYDAGRHPGKDPHQQPLWHRD